jgi:hypothetical protein
LRDGTLTLRGRVPDDLKSRLREHKAELAALVGAPPTRPRTDREPSGGTAPPEAAAAERTQPLAPLAETIADTLAGRDCAMTPEGLAYWLEDAGWHPRDWPWSRERLLRELERVIPDLRLAGFTVEITRGRGWAVRVRDEK